MIKGIGIDITEIERVRKAAVAHSRFIQHVLTTAEQEQYGQFSNQRAVEYLAGRWSLKESFAKAYGTGIGTKLGFHDIEIIDNQYGAPIVTKSPYNGNVHASVSHTASLVMTEVILESENEND
ncbi:holo-ACP synthase [Limosilactobacillus sp. STM2_1]|uniref:Holo-[acyl-carrier-protein] synthase n=1 Tax=Limosilactobacillus rudii TaxID=2759755 RepID=A0A7W3YNP5_9LACO|nr:holo-ACP synthase [Limosilactobacillus rudii]MBB1079603.1 holo-ACP synthase [Limosilactobacillus rudii]MBB1097681.1 holo-ACP synthase [Limosilactobacillus rudii]MCD7134790.1 holo-ACP synthase [Limosilactobacillus rudii]